MNCCCSFHERSVLRGEVICFFLAFDDVFMCWNNLFSLRKLLRGNLWIFKHRTLKVSELFSCLHIELFHAFCEYNCNQFVGKANRALLKAMNCKMSTFEAVVNRN